MGRRYRRSTVNSVVRDTAEAANLLSWWGAALLGFVAFALFYWVLPMWLQSKLDDLQGNMFRPIVETWFGRRAHWSQWLGIALGLIGLFFAVRNYVVARRMDRSELRGVGFLARWLARFLD